MGAEIKVTDNGVELEVHRFDDEHRARNYLTIGREYVFEHTETLCQLRFDHYKGPVPGERAVLRFKNNHWQAIFWIVGGVRVTSASPYEGKAVWHGEYRIPSGEWITVRNGAGRPIAYTTRGAAYAGAEYMARLQHIMPDERESRVV